MRRLGFILPLIASTAACLAADQPVFDTEFKPLLEQYCLDCHSSDSSEADVDLALFRSEVDALKHRRVWLRVRQVLEGMDPLEIDEILEAEADEEE